MRMFAEPAVFVDIETNGSTHERGRIIEIAAIKVEGGKIIDEFVSLINPGMAIPHWITSLTGISQNDLVQAPYFDEIAHQLHTFLEGAIFVAHNVRFDYSFIRRYFEKCDYDYKPKLFCTVRMSRFMYPEHTGHSLEKIIKRHKISVEDRHRAYADARAIYEFTQLAIAEKGHEHFAQSVVQQLKTKTLPPNLDENYLKNIRSTTGVYVFENNEGLPLYVGKSVNLRSRILSHFAQDTKVAREMRLSQSTHKLRTIETENELEALLLESQMIKELSPIYNRQLRRKNNQTLFIKVLDEQGYATIKLENKEIATVENKADIYGVYGSRTQAKATLETLVKEYKLCPKLLNLEKSNTTCFSYQLGKCRGACVGEESASLYNARIETALTKSKIASWPYKSAVALHLSEGRAIVIDQWIIVGYLEPVEEEEHYFKKIINKFDLDTYKILRRFISDASKNVKIVPYTP